jgi:glycosyltransferase involved in cell wall biosynthesis
MQIPYIISTHDYYFICPSYNLLDKNAQFCFEHKSEIYCQECSQSLFGEGKDLRQNWYSICQELFTGASEIISPSAAAGSYFAREYPDFSDKMKVIRHGVLKELENERRAQFRTNIAVVKNKSLPIKVAFVGNFVSYIKGAHLIIDLLEKVATQEDLKNSFVFEGYGGCVETTDNSTMKSLKKHIEFRGAYNRQELPELLKHTDVVILPAIWSETYSLVADEVLSLGIPIITTHLGAIAERVREYNVGWVSKSVSTEGLLEVLASLASNPDELPRMKANIQRYPLISYETMAQRYLEEYRTFEVHQYERNKSMKTELDLRSLFVAYLKAKWLLDNPAV